MRTTNVNGEYSEQIVTYRLLSNADGEMADKPTSIAVHSVCNGNPGALREYTSRVMQLAFNRRAKP